MRVGASLWEGACPCRKVHFLLGGVSPCDTRSVLLGVRECVLVGGGMSFRRHAGVSLQE